MTEGVHDSALDCMGMKFPLPILKTKKAVDDLNGGQVLKLIAAEPGSINDVFSRAKRTGNPWLSQTE